MAVEECCVTGLIKSRVNRDQPSGVCVGSEMACQLAKRGKAQALLEELQAHLMFDVFC